MTAMHLSSALIAWRDRCVWGASMLISASSLMFGCEAIAQEPITAVYKAQEVAFHYRSSRQFYSCHELQNRVANILLAVGARDDIDVKASNCDGYLIPEDTSLDFPVPGRDRASTWDRRRPSAGFRQPGNDRDQSARVRVRLMMPVEVTPQVLEEIDKDKSRRELVSRVTGNVTAALNDPIVFAARREEVTLSHHTIRLQPEDCDLLEQMTLQVFRKLGVRVVRKNLGCGPRESSRIPPQLTVEALLPTGALLPMPAPERKADPGASDDSAPEATEPTAEPAPR